MPLLSSALGRACLLGASLSLGAVALRADFTENLIARWTFNQPGPLGLVDDVKGLRLEPAKHPKGLTSAPAAPTDGVVKLALGDYLVATGLSDAESPALKNSVTLWARLRIDGGDADRTGFLFGLMQRATPGDWQDSSLVLVHRPQGMNENTGFGAFGRVEPALDFGFGNHTLPDTPGRFVNIALIFNGRAETVTLWVDGAQKTVRKPAARALRPSVALLLGQLKEAGGADVTFDEFRVYQGAISPDWLGDITPVAKP